MKKNNQSELSVYLTERDKALSNLDMDYARKMLPYSEDDEIRLVAMHKARYSCLSIARELRHASGAWLRERNYKDAIGMDLLPEGELPA